MVKDLNNGSTTSVSITGKNPGTTYTFKMRAKNSIGLSAFSALFSIQTTKTVPDPPTALTEITTSTT